MIIALLTALWLHVGTNEMKTRILQTMVDLKSQGQPLPRVLYLVPNGQNPVSYIAPLERRQALYHICRKHDLMIVEDDPYFYLQFPYDSKHACHCLSRLRHVVAFALAHSLHLCALWSEE